MSISGIENTAWNDILARLSLPDGDRAWNILTAGKYIAVQGTVGTIYIWQAATFAPEVTVNHQEAVTKMCLNSKGDRLATYGLRSTKLWTIPAGHLLSCSPNPVDTKAMAITFIENDRQVIVACDDRLIRYIHTSDFDSGWHTFDPALLKEESHTKNMFINSPMWMEFNGDGSQLGVSYRGFPLSVWSLAESRRISLYREMQKIQRPSNPSIHHYRPLVSSRPIYVESYFRAYNWNL